MKPNPDEVAKTFKGLAIAAARAKTLAKDYGKEKLVANLQRRQQDSIRQYLLDIQADVESTLRVMTGK